MAIELQKQSNIAKVNVLNELLPQKYESGGNGLCLETSWRCVFSHDNQLFAYSSGDSIVHLIDYTKLISRYDRNRDESANNYNNNNNDLNINNNINNNFNKSIECNHLVRSVSFALMANLHKSTAFWHRSAQFKQYFLITGHSSGRVRIWDIDSGKLLLELLDHKACVTHVECNDTGILASTSTDGTIKLWDLIDGGNLLKTIKNDGKPLFGCRWAPDSKSFVTFGMRKTVFVYEAHDYTVKHKLVAHQHTVSSADYSPDSRLIVTASWDTTAIIWNANSGEILTKLYHLKPRPTLMWAGGENGHHIRSVSFSPDGAHIATVADDGFVRIWDICNDDSPEAICPVTHGLCCTYSKSGQVLAVGTRSGSVTVLESHSCVKSLLFLCRLAIGKHMRWSSDTIDANDNTLAIPHGLVNYLNYQELT
ncbi:WD repeat and SOCS box-containing protein 1-like [Oppia nitens]|uniref:WD repeat and SOCS box-containing protein 1-like n=1 Tax=Oppia nitens TaxID=1686743 RepID=UPI0023DC2C0D|nr:WD repeat and SOCS box-containing protein 1-like [Oppia nitens]